MIIAVNILGAAEGLRPREVMLAKALAAKTAQGPNMHSVKIIVSAKFLSILYVDYFSTIAVTLSFSALTTPRKIGKDLPSTSIIP